MSALGPGISTQDKETTWADVKPTIHTQSRLKLLALNAWRLAGYLADQENPDWLRINNLQAAARDLERMDREGWEGEVTAQEADYQDQQKSERP